MNPARELIEKMLRQGRVGEVSSTIGLSAALAVKRGIADAEDVQINFLSSAGAREAIPEDLASTLKALHADAVADFRRATPEELEHAIALYSAHLRAAGYSIDDGYDH